MMCSLVLRRLEPGTYEQFRQTWEPGSPGAWPTGFQRLWLLRSDEDPDVVGTFSLLDLDAEGLERLRDSAWMSSEASRLAHVAEFEEELIASGYFEVVEELSPSVGTS